MLKTGEELLVERLEINNQQGFDLSFQKCFFATLKK
jgi:hypothetical protein